MFYTPEILCMRKKGKLARVWLAATLNERLFKQSVSNKALLAIDINATCDEILNMVVSGGQFRSKRFSLYLSSQLMYGMVKLHNYQTKIFEASLSRIEYQLKPVDEKLKRMSSASEQRLIRIDLPEIPPVKETFKDLHLRTDLHLLPEADLEAITKGRRRAFVQSPTFGGLTEEEVDFFLTEDNWELQTLVGPDMDGLNQPIRYDEHKTNQRPILLPFASGIEDLAITNGSKNTEDTVAVEDTGSVLRTPKKRESRTANVDTPTKRRRRNLEIEMNRRPQQTSVEDDRSSEAPETIQPTDPNQQYFLDDQPGIPDHTGPDIELNNIPVDSTILQPNRPEDIGGPDDNEIHLDSLDSDFVIGPRRKRTRRIVIDKHMTLRQEELQRFITNPLAHTISVERSQIVSMRMQLIPANLLLVLPSKSHRPIHKNSVQNRPRYYKWPPELQDSFKLRTIGPFTAENDYAMSVEQIRALDERDQQNTEEISSGLGKAMGNDSSSRNKTDTHTNLVNLPSIDERTADDNQQPLASIDINEPTVEDIGEMENTHIPDEPESKVLVGQEENNNGQDAKAPRKETPDTGDLDAFLPPQLKSRDVVKKTSHEKRSTPETIVDLLDSPLSVRSEESYFQNDWNYQELRAFLAVHWEQCGNTRALKFTDVVPPESCTKLDAAACFGLLLELHKDNIVNLVQEEFYSDIYIYETAGPRPCP